MLSVLRLISLSTFEVIHASENACASVPVLCEMQLHWHLNVLPGEPISFILPKCEVPIEDTSKIQFQKIEDEIFDD